MSDRHLHVSAEHQIEQSRELKRLRKNVVRLTQAVEFVLEHKHNVWTWDDPASRDEIISRCESVLRAMTEDQR